MPEAPSAAELLLLGAPDCHLCAGAQALLTELSGPLGFFVTKIDITSDPTLEREFRWAIPVIKLGDVEVARAPIRRATLETRLRELLGR